MYHLVPTPESFEIFYLLNIYYRLSVRLLRFEVSRMTPTLRTNDLLGTGIRLRNFFSGIILDDQVSIYLIEVT
jgi:hypothetical protein